METLQMLLTLVVSNLFSGGLVYVFTIKIQKKKMSGEASLAEAEADAKKIENVESQLDIYVRMMENLKSEIMTSSEDVKQLKVGIQELKTTLFEVAEIVESNNEVSVIRERVRSRVVKFSSLIVFIVLMLLTSCATIRNKSVSKSESNEQSKFEVWERIEKTDIGNITTKTQTITVTDFAVMRNPDTGQLESTPEKQTQTVNTTVVENKNQSELAESKANGEALSGKKDSIVEKHQKGTSFFLSPIFIISLLTVVSIFAVKYRKWIIRIFRHT